MNARPHPDPLLVGTARCAVRTTERSVRWRNVEWLDARFRRLTLRSATVTSQRDVPTCCAQPMLLQPLLFLLLMLVLSACNKPPYSSPTALRDTNAYFKAISPAAPAALNRASLDQASTSMDGSTLVITRPAMAGPSESNDGYDHKLKRLASGEKLEGDGATFELLAFSVSGPGISPAPTNGNRNVPVDFFSPDGKPLSRAQLKALGFRDRQLTEYVYLQALYINHTFPKLKVWFGSKQRPPGCITPVGCFDAQTKRSLVSGYGYSQISRDDPGYVELRPRVWHATPIEVVLDVQLDGKVVVETNAAAGMTVPVPGGLVRLLSVSEGNRNSWSSQSSGGTETFRLGLDRSEGKTNAIAIFMTDPAGLAVQCELLDAQGKEFNGRDVDSSGDIRMVGVEGRVEDVKAMRFTVYTNHHRVAVRIPPFPNLPASRQNIANLFEVSIPLVVLNRASELGEYISTATEMEFRYSSFGSGLPTNLFPLTLTNATPADLMTFYHRNLTNNWTLVVDENKQEIRIEPTLLEKARRWVRQKLGR